MDPQEELAKDQSNASDSAEVQEEPEDTTTGDPVTEDVLPQQLTENEESTVNRVDVPDTSAREETEPEETVAEQDTVGLGEDTRLGAEEGDPVTEDALPQQLTENEESTVNRVDVPDTSARKETEPEETVAEQDTVGLGEDTRLGAEEGQYPPQELEGERGDVPDTSAQEETQPEETVAEQDTMGLGEAPRLGAEEGQYPPQEIEGERVEEGSEKSDGHVLAEAEAITTEFTESFPEKQQAEKPTEQTTSEALVEIEPNRILEVKDSKVGSDEPVEGRPALDEDRGGKTSVAEK